MNVIEILRKFRKENKYSQSNFAKVLNMSTSNYSEIEQQRNNLKAEDFVKLIKYFDIPFEIFLNNEEHENLKILEKSQIIKSLEETIEKIKKDL